MTSKPTTIPVLVRIALSFLAGMFIATSVIPANGQSFHVMLVWQVHYQPEFTDSTKYSRATH